MNSFQHNARTIRLLICDVDGVLTNGQLHFTEQGETLKTFHVHDGLGLKLLREFGIEVAIITSRKSAMVQTRLEQLGINHIFQGQKDKLQAYEHLKASLQLTNEEIAYVGDDLPDLICMEKVGLSIAVNNAVDTIKKQAHWVTSKNGGQGAVREVAETLLKAQEHWPKVLEQFVS